jgi:hypothetical protein
LSLVVDFLVGFAADDGRDSDAKEPHMMGNKAEAIRCRYIGRKGSASIPTSRALSKILDQFTVVISILK